MQEHGQRGGGKKAQQKNDEHDEPGPTLVLSIACPENDQSDHHDPQIGKAEGH